MTDKKEKMKFNLPLFFVLCGFVGIFYYQKGFSFAVICAIPLAVIFVLDHYEYKTWLVKKNEETTQTDK